MNRRELLLSWRGLLAALAAAAAAPPALFFWQTSRLRESPPERWGDMGSASKLEEGWQRRVVLLETRNRWRRETREETVYVRSRGEAIEALSAICPHNGCLVKPDAGGFACPCHRSLFDADGRSLEGPSPRPLDRLLCKVERGRALVRYQRFRPGSKHPEPIDA